MDILFEVVFPLFLAGAFMVSAAIFDQIKKKNQTQFFDMTEFYDEDNQENEVDTRTQRIQEQEKKVQQFSESKNHVRLADTKKRLSREPVRKPGALETNVYYQKPKRIVTKTIFRDSDEVQKAIIYGELLGTPVSQKRRNSR